MKRLLTAGLLTLAATPALAHHPLGGLPMTTFSEGLLSGVGHPVLGFDHLFFVAIMGVAAIFTARRYAAPAAYVAAMLVGTALMYAGIGMPMKETVVVLSLLAIGGVVLSGRALGMTAALALFAGFGLFHGSAFGDAVAGTEAAVGGGVLLGYLVGLGAVQYGIALAAGYVAEKVLGATEATSVNARLAGAMAAGVGVFLALEMLEAPIVSMLAAG